jgi:hypothetical protein
MKTHCKDCGGVSICHHGKQRSKCIDCGGSNICQHGKIKYYCKNCKNCKNICQNNVPEEQPVSLPIVDIQEHKESENQIILKMEKITNDDAPIQKIFGNSNSAFHKYTKFKHRQICKQENGITSKTSAFQIWRKII